MQKKGKERIRERIRGRRNEENKLEFGGRKTFWRDMNISL